MSDFDLISCERPPLREPRVFNREPFAGWEFAVCIVVAVLVVLWWVL